VGAWWRGGIEKGKEVGGWEGRGEEGWGRCESRMGGGVGMRGASCTRKWRGGEGVEGRSSGGGGGDKGKGRDSRGVFVRKR